jgi:hypothetical protein
LEYFITTHSHEMWQTAISRVVVSYNNMQISILYQCNIIGVQSSVTTSHLYLANTSPESTHLISDIPSGVFEEEKKTVKARSCNREASQPSLPVTHPLQNRLRTLPILQPKSPITIQAAWYSLTTPKILTFTASTSCSSLCPKVALSSAKTS